MATAASVATDWTTCPICLEVFDNPKSLPCIHGFCLRCLERHFKDKLPGDEVPCPLCRKEFKIPPEGLDGLQHHFFIQHLVDAKNVSTKSTEELLCQACLEENEDEEGSVSAATMYCVDCNESLCEKCSRHHRRTTMKGGAHQVRPLGAELEQELIQVRRSYCEKHKDEQLKLYCYDCNENICVVCFAVKHRNHSSEEIPEVAENLKPRIDEDDKKILSSIDAVRQQLEQTKQGVLKFTSQVENVEKMVREAGEAIKQLVDSQISKHLVELQTVKSECCKQAEIVQEQLQLELVALESFHKYSRELLDKGRPSDITRAANELHKRATELMDSDVSSVQYCPPHVTFAPADITQLTSLQLTGLLKVINSGEHPAEHQKVGVVASRLPCVPCIKGMKQQTSFVRDVSLLEQQMKERQIGPVRHNLVQGDGVWGVTLLDNLIYVLREKTSEQIAVYDADSYRLQRKITVPHLNSSCDMAACPFYKCIYACGVDDQQVHKVALLKDCVTTWSVNDTAKYLSVTDSHSVLVTCQEVRKIKEFSTDGKLLHEIQLSRNVVRPRRTIRLSSGKLVVCHGQQGVCLIDSDGHVVKSYGGPQSSGTQRLNLPVYLAVDRNGFIFVADTDNDRVLLLSPALNYIREVLSREQLKWTPLRLCFDSDRSRLYVGVNEYKDGHFTRGRVAVVNI